MRLKETYDLCELWGVLGVLEIKGRCDHAARRLPRRIALYNVAADGTVGRTELDLFVVRAKHVRMFFV